MIYFFLFRLHGVVRFPFRKSTVFDDLVHVLLKIRSISGHSSKYLVLLFLEFVVACSPGMPLSNVNDFLKVLTRFSDFLYGPVLIFFKPL